ncbi:heptaprenyl diphosphate synthase (HEPPP synthase) subunit 1 family protein [Staphylococcus petrasii]|uniref:Heptaprenyl diphosphate synthase (HEPPP synthase) subunit 1 family protein n=1 Tax=Staphylococcus petrasii TaxID=1276936 RepID=A0A380G1S5_9STAP|nr:heptaprenyl pyrophosphate synthase subunit A [Staphylococcus petrasii]PNZ26680.1 heptaprenyl pyrophosphate synthase subunit A [Staphylococcus petrasii]TGE13255.1 heptaprenyl pyrophosphate synthase subunit A [Staphylococcus petrasii]TGE19461.1 heptaprenyl pyrophosphate synthase subunit A [Staphylococcus petrasii]SUM44198.1 heptaprenyl diphosphate synthase (HEPPP synthase) subunit 1 family protein [Staphylococcus petrasii]
MERTLSILNRQIDQRLMGVTDYESININSNLSDLLDSYDIPENAKLACLTIDTSMKHLDEISHNKLSKKSILIGDLLSAHFYTLLAEIDDPAFQLAISQAIVKSNELKSSLHHQSLEAQDIYEAIIKIETIFPFITLSHFSNQSISEMEIFYSLFENVETYYPSYLKMYTENEVEQFFKTIKQSYIEKSRGNING